MEFDIKHAIDQISKEKGIDRALIIEAVEEAMKSAAHKTYGAELNIDATYNPESGSVDMFRVHTVVEEVADPDNEISLEFARSDIDQEAEVGDELMEEIDSAPLGRIAAQAAKQNIVQKVRDYERSIIYGEFKEQEGSVISGVVLRFERRNLVVQLRPNVEAILPEREQIPRERYRQQERVRAVIKEVNDTLRGTQIVLSRTAPELVAKLFEQEVPEVYEGIVEIKDVVREPGGRAKISVVSKDSDVDPVGACVGMRGNRVQAVVQELRGERIDIVPWTPDETEFVCRALSPAKVSRIVIDEEAHAMEVVVPDAELALAIGRKGQNIRLAARLSGWKLDVLGDADYERRLRESRLSLQGVAGLGELQAEVLLGDGYKSAAELSNSSAADVAAALSIEEDAAAAFLASAAIAAEEQRRTSMVRRVAAAISDAVEAANDAEKARLAEEERAAGEESTGEESAEGESAGGESAGSEAAVKKDASDDEPAKGEAS